MTDFISAVICFVCTIHSTPLPDFIYSHYALPIRETSKTKKKKKEKRMKICVFCTFQGNDKNLKMYMNELNIYKFYFIRKNR